MPQFACELRSVSIYRTLIDAPTREHAEQRMRVLVADNEIAADTRDIDVEAWANVYCEDCGEEHYGPTCKKPIGGCTVLPCDERRAI